MLPATKIEEYVPTTTPIIIAKTKSLIVVPPKKYKATRVNNVVKDVFTERANV